MGISDEPFIVFVLGVLISGIFFCALFFVLGGDVQLSQEAADDICKQLTEDDAAVSVYDENNAHKLVCEVPSYDATQNIIIRLNSKGDN